MTASISPATAGPSSRTVHTIEAATPAWLRRADAWAERVSDRVNPILVKETRQALKSRQFVVTFSVLLTAALGWTVAGSLSMMPQIYTTPSAPRMLIGYYALLALPMLLIVPLTAYRSLESEIDDGTLELLSISALSPWQIVLGKLASASLQMMLYLVTLFPCVAYAYTLRGVDLPTLGLMMLILIVAGLFLTVFALALAPLAHGRSGRVTTLLTVILLLLISEYGVGTTVVLLILFGNPLPGAETVFIAIGLPLVLASLGHLCLTATAAQLTPESENRSSPLRLVLLGTTALVCGLAAYAIENRRFDSDFCIACYFIATALLTGLWAFASPMLAAESANLTPRIQRELPSSFASRVALTFLTPGPATGLVFAILGVVGIAALVPIGLDRLALNPDTRVPAQARTAFTELAIIIGSYYVIGLVLARWLVAVVRIKNHPRVELGLAAFIVVAVVMALVPFSVGLHLNDYREYPYSAWQVTNWAWTISQTANGSLPNKIKYGIVAAAVLGLLSAIGTVGERALAVRTETPDDMAAQPAGREA
ncbi:MAG: ABC transporter permease [Planctomycetota bacterium]